MNLARSAWWLSCALGVSVVAVNACGSSDDHRKPSSGAGENAGGDASPGGSPGSEGGAAGEHAAAAGNAGRDSSSGGVPPELGGAPGQAGADMTDAGAAGLGVVTPDPNVTSRAAAWSVRFGGTGQQQSTAIAAPLTGGGVVVVGQMEGTIVTTKKTLTSAGSYDAFAIKLDESGVVQWAVSFGDAGDQRATAVAIDASGNVFVGGFTQPASSIDFGSGTQTGGTFFIVELGPTGVYKRGGVVPSDGNTRLKGLTIGPSDTVVYVADLPTGASLTAGCSPPFTNQYSNPDPTNAAVVVELTPTLQCVQDMGVGADAMLGVVYTLKDKLVLAERLPGSGQTPSSVSVMGYPFAKWSMGGSLLDSIAAQGAGAQIYEVNTATDGGGGLLFGGGYTGTAALINTTVFPSKTDGEGAFVAKTDETGAVAWSRSYGSQASGRVSSVAAKSNSGRSFIAGSAQGILDFGSGPVLPVGKDVPFDNTFFVAALAGNGDPVWATRFALGASYPTIAIAAALDDTSYVTGALNGTTNLGKGDLTSAGDDDVFVAKFAP